MPAHDKIEAIRKNLHDRPQLWLDVQEVLLEMYDELYIPHNKNAPTELPEEKAVDDLVNWKYSSTWRYTSPQGNPQIWFCLDPETWDWLRIFG